MATRIQPRTPGTRTRSSGGRRSRRRRHDRRDGLQRGHRTRQEQGRGSRSGHDQAAAHRGGQSLGHRFGAALGRRFRLPANRLVPVSGSTGSMGAVDSSVRTGTEQLRDRLHRQRIPRAAQRRDQGVRHRGDHRRVPPRLSSVGVRQVQLDDRALERRQRIVEPPRVVGERPRVDDDRRVSTPRAAWISSTGPPRGWTDGGSAPDPASAAAFSARRTWSSSVSVPYTSGSRWPRRFRFGPDSNRIERGSPDRSRAADTSIADRRRRPPRDPTGPSSTKVRPAPSGPSCRAPSARPDSVGVEVGRDGGTAGHRPTLRGGVRRPRHPRSDPDDGRARPRRRGRSRRPHRGGGGDRWRSRSRGPACGRSSAGRGRPVSRSSLATTSALI